MSRRWVPGATYRVQLRREFTFDDAAAVVPYLARLGVDTLYTSPFLRARPESTHGYDVSDHNALNPSLGGEPGFARLSDALRKAGLGLLVDVVPNHMGIGEPSNYWWMDVLENGPSSVYADYFDVDWHPVTAELEDRLLLPILGDRYARVLERGQIRVELDGGAFILRYYDTVLPLSPRTYAQVLARARERLPGDDEAAMELESIITASRNLPADDERDPDRRAERHRETEVIKRRLAVLVETRPDVVQAVDAALDELNGRPGDRHSFDALHELLDAQPYRLAYWRTASEEINYRRFFDVNDLAGIRMENDEVFQATHRLLLSLVDEGRAQGFRIDHPDGLWDPRAYLERLRADHPTLYVVVEKILARGEALPTDWPVDGTVGYEFLNALNGLFVDPRGRRRLDQVYQRFLDRPLDFEQIAYESKRLICQASLAAETNTLASQLRRIAERNRLFRDFTLYNLRFAIREVIACFPVYRTYVDERTTQIDPRDRAYVELAVRRARQRNPALDPSVFTFIRDVLLLSAEQDEDEETRRAQRRWVLKFQQTTAPVAAKGVEDTAFYIFNRLVSLNEVGGEPDHFGVSLEEFHRLNAERAVSWRHGLSTTSTHDTKRSEDVRARIDVLSEIPAEFGRAIAQWIRRNRRKRRVVDGRPAPDRNEEYLLYQTLLGVWPLGAERAPDELVERVVAYMAKATKEAKVNTSWINPNDEWDEAVASFVRAVLADEQFLTDFLPLQKRVARYGAYNALSQTLLKLASPGVPDVYQGQELWDFSLVDPDNRRPVDYDLRRRMLEELVARPDTKRLMERWEDGAIKLWLTHKGLWLRRRWPELFALGDYRPLYGTGRARDHVVAFARRHAEAAVVALAPRLVVRLTPDPAQPPIGGAVWADDELVLGDDAPPGRYCEVLTGRDLELRGGRLRLAEAFAELPVALLERKP